MQHDVSFCIRVYNAVILLANQYDLKYDTYMMIIEANQPKDNRTTFECDGRVDHTTSNLIEKWKQFEVKRSRVRSDGMAH